MIHHYTLRVFVRSTESMEKVIKAVKTVDPYFDTEGAAITEHRGIYGNIFYSISYSGGRREARRLWNYIFNHLDAKDREYLKEHVLDHLDELGRLHLRLDKHKAYQGKLVLGESNVIKLVFQLEAYPATYEKFKEVARGLVCSTT